VLVEVDVDVVDANRMTSGNINNMAKDNYL
jgi:hypothetical protein